jgi:hypothetical protein
MQFTIFGLMVLMFVASIGFGQLYYMFRGDKSSRPVAVMMSVAMPMLVMIIISIGYTVSKWLRRR